MKDIYSVQLYYCMYKIISFVVTIASCYYCIIIKHKEKTHSIF